MFLFLIIAILSVILDQGIKFLINLKIQLGSEITVIDNFLSITNLRNTGAAWSTFSNKTIYLIIITVIFLFAFIYFILRKSDFKHDKSGAIIYGIIIGGIIGNLIDRIRLGYVVDYLSFNIFGYNFPVFNLADSLIVIGCIIMIIRSFKRGDNK